MIKQAVVFFLTARFSYVGSPTTDTYRRLTGNFARIYRLTVVITEFVFNFGTTN